MATEFPDVPDYTSNYPILVRSIIRVIRGIMKGRTNNAYAVTLTANSATTTLTFAEHILGQNTLIIFTPQTANASAEIGAGTMYLSSRDVINKTATITHANNAQTDRTFGYILVG